MKLTSDQYMLLPTEEDIEFYNQHGYYISKKIFSDEEIDDAIYGVERYYAGERDFTLPSAIKMFDGGKSEDADSLRLNDYVSLQNREISELVYHPLLGAIAARLCGAPPIRLWHDQLICKPVEMSNDKKVGIGWHTDRAYWKTCASTNMLTAWIPFHDCDEVMGTLMVIDGSHRWSGNVDLRGFHSADLEGLETQFITDGHPIVKVPINLEKGQVSFHHCLTLHGSSSNKGKAPRLSLSIHMQDGTNQYCEHRDEHGAVTWHHNDVLCRKKTDGQPDYNDPDICPILYS
jgi:ectoine hydroxylase-related dioxygenase (phytanoyl-CoA dioxygenase family)